MDTSTEPQPAFKYRFALLAALLIAFSSGLILRYQAAMTTELVPGINGAYYPLQVRSILEGSGLAISDFPLLFYFDAGIALLFSFFSPTDTAIVLATRLVDLVLPLLVVVPLGLFAAHFSQDRKKSFRPAAAVLLVGLVAVGNTSLLRMAGDFQKNAVALPLSLTFLFFLYKSFSSHQWRDYLLASFFLIVTCLTHLGVTALTLTLGGLYAVIALATHPNRKRAILIAGTLLLIAVITLGAVYLLDPTRIERLLGVILDPNSLFVTVQEETARQIGGFTFFEERLLLGNLLGVIGIFIAIYLREKIDKPTRILLWAASLTALLFASPLISPAWSQRLALMAFLPGLIPLIFVGVREDWGTGIAGGLAFLVLLTTFTTPSAFAKETLTTPAHAELEDMRVYLEGNETLVFAEHGLEWWAAWTMETDITNRYYLAAENWEEYDAVYVLTQINPTAFSSEAKPQGEQPPQGGTPALQPAGANLQARPPGDEQPTQGMELVYTGEYFTLSQVVEQPEVLRGSGPPELEGEIEEISANQLIIDGQTVNILEDTIVSFGPKEGSLDQLEVGSRVIVWGEWRGLFNRQLDAGYLTVIPTNRGANPPPQADQGQLAPGQPAGTVQLGPLTMVTRAGWGARVLNPNAREETGWFDEETNPLGVLRYPQPVADWLTTVVVHHSALPVEQGPAEIQALHMDKSGYADIGYHFLIGTDGTLYEGRPIQLRGAHTQGFNTGTIGVVLLGNFENTDPTQQQLQTLNQLIRFLINRYGITHLAGHHDFNPEITVCPGTNLYKLLPNLAARAGLTYGTGGYKEPSWNTP
jgi:hypothetical protein